MRRLSTPRLLVLTLAVIFSIALSACSGTSTPGTGATPSSNAKTVALVTDTGGIHDQSFNEAAYNGYLVSQAQYGFKKQVIQSTSESDYVKNLTLAAKTSDLTIGVGFLMATAVDTVAKEFPTKEFALIDACPTSGTSSDCDTTLKNVSSLYYKEQEAGCLVGAAAGEIELLGKSSKMPNLLGSNTIAAVGGQEIPPVDHYIAGYQYCAKLVDKNITVLVNYSNSFTDTAKCQDIAINDISRKAEIIFQVAGGCGNGALQAAKAKNVYSIGVDSDQSGVNNSVITSAIKRVDKSVTTTITNLETGNFTASPATFDLKHDGVGYAPLSSIVPAQVKTIVDQYTTKITSGAIQVPDAVSK